MKRLSENDLVGQRFGRLVIMSFSHCQNRRSSWLCLCDCGNSSVVNYQNLKNGSTSSCGCYTRELSTTHGASGTPEHRVWKSMRGRCYNKKSMDYYLYGGRGIVVCARWRYSFTNFLADMGKRPSAKHSIERKNVNENYEPENCIWALPTVQSRNTRRTVNITAFGKTQCQKDWSIELGISEGTITYRLRKGLTPEEALSLAARNQAGYINKIIEGRSSLCST